jgi:hypothetical protein
VRRIREHRAIFSQTRGVRAAPAGFRLGNYAFEDAEVVDFAAQWPLAG